MKPIYFPFTCIPQPKAAIVSGFLGQTTVLQPAGGDQPAILRQMADDGLIDICVPHTEDDDHLVRCISEFTHWGQLHQGAEMSLKDFFKSDFSQESFSVQIRTDILKDGKKVAPSPDPIFLARLFLMMAQELDMRQTEIALELANSQSAEKDLFTRMTGESDDSGRITEDFFKNDFGAYQTGSRISAWCRIFEKIAREYPFLVTDSRSVVEEILDKITGFEKIGIVEGLSGRLPERVIHSFTERLKDLAATPWETRSRPSFEGLFPVPDPSAGEGRKINFHLYLLPRVSPGGFCRLMAGAAAPEKDGARADGISPSNTLMGFIEI